MGTNLECYDGDGHFDDHGNVIYTGKKEKEDVNNYDAYSFFDISHNGKNGIVIFLTPKKTGKLNKPEKFKIKFNIKNLIPYESSSFDIKLTEGFLAIVDSKEFDLDLVKKYYDQLSTTTVASKIASGTVGKVESDPIIGEGTGIIRRP
ncbi:hypothetical protein [Flavobacterium restrictum]|uniref:Uncharacterized protein n=1 Tax=Flavobacterium restrictum TaxID=2594428 RepID=A0A553E2H3_9FLAO|nr:hypothetical protein [Flavobacterium restrictum]TRX39228.1 hypothetical protein FNW21_09845 [Flavobacterium restrictum]